MSYLEFLIQWYNWPYIAGSGLALVALLFRERLRRPGERLGSLLGFGQVPGSWTLTVFGLSLGVVGLTFSGAIHDYWPEFQGPAALPILAVSLVFSLLITRSMGKTREKYFPEIRAVQFFAAGLEGMEGKVVSRVISPDYRAGRAQVVDEEGTLHVVMCKTRGEELSFADSIRLVEYDSEDGRYFVEIDAGASGATAQETADLT